MGRTGSRGAALQRQLTLPLETTPRRRLWMHGSETLSDVELLALAAGWGRSEHDALALGQRILVTWGSSRRLAAATACELCALPGVGPATAACVVAGLELGRRATRPAQPKPVIGSAADVGALIGEEMGLYDREHFRVLLLDTKNQLVGMEDISVGSLSQSLVHPRELFKAAIRRSAAGVVVVHNHPSGDATPSVADIELTRRLARAGDVLGIDLLDHVIVGDGRWTSLKELNYI